MRESNETMVKGQRGRGFRLFSTPLFLSHTDPSTRLSSSTAADPHEATKAPKARSTSWRAPLAARAAHQSLGPTD